MAAHAERYLVTAVPAAVVAALLPVLETFEDCKLCAYPDPVGVWTIGYGHTGPEVVEGLQWTQQQADEAVSADLADDYSELTILFPACALLSPAKQAALLDFVYNEGSGKFQHSTLRQRLLAGDYDAVPSELEKWDLAGGKVLAGLDRRRLAEIALWNAQL